MKHILKNRILKSTLLTLVFCSIPAWASLASASTEKVTINLDQGTGNTEFRATGHPSAIKIVGKGPCPKGSLVLSGMNLTGSAQFELASLVTGINLRDKHMKEKYLEIEKFPRATLTVKQMTIPQTLGENASMSGVPFSGTLLLHGVEHPVTGTAQLSRKGNQIAMNAQFGLKIADYGIPIPTFAGITMADEVQISVESSAPFVSALSGTPKTTEE